MYTNEDLQSHLETSPNIKVRAAIIAEWNMNLPDKISKIGNYRYRPAIEENKSFENFGLIAETYDPEDTLLAYTNATDADIVVDNGVDDNIANPTPLTFVSKKEKEKLLYSLEDCFSRFRPRSGINKLRYFENKYSHYTNQDMAVRPRYYMAHKDDTFKYWTSYRTENGEEVGVSRLSGGQEFISDAAPFIVYKENIPSNRIVVKTQTNIGNINLGPFTSNDGAYDDPFYGDENKTVPVEWKVQVLKNSVWVDAASFSEDIFSHDGYAELAYGLLVPDEFSTIFNYIRELTAFSQLPKTSAVGDAYLVKETPTDLGVFYVYTKSGETGYESFVPSYGWFRYNETISSQNGLMTELVNTPQYTDPLTSTTKYREFEYISGIRLVVTTMSKADCSFDLIELSPRLAVDISEITMTYSITKSASDLGNAGLPVGQLLASTGSISIFDNENAFNENNPDSIIADYLFSKNIQIKFYEVLEDVPVDDALSRFYIPIKTMYIDGFPEIDKETRQVSITLRDLFFYFESTNAPQVFIPESSLSYAVSLLLDSIGFSNYSFKRLSTEKEATIPYFFIPPEKTVAEILQDLALSTQTAMFFDEYNNFVLMSKEYMIPTDTVERPTDTVLRGTKDFAKASVDDGDDTVARNKNTAVDGKLANILAISASTNQIFNDGIIAYNSRYIQKTYGSLRQASFIDQDVTWVYKPVLLWEVSGTEITKAKNDSIGTQSAYTLSSIPLSVTLSDDLPEVSEDGTEIINNTMNFGEGIYWISRYNGYFYANGEIIKYDAVEFSVPGEGNVWISSAQEYSYYFAQLPFNGKIYPTGLVRIFSEPNYRVVSGDTVLKPGAVAKHGRGQFGTSVVTHEAGANSYWTNTGADAPIRGVEMDSKYLFGQSADFNVFGVYSETSSRGTVSISNDSGIKLTSVYGHRLSANNRVYFTSTGTLPTGIEADEYYYAVIVNENNIKISTTKNGANIVPYTNSGSGLLTLNVVVSENPEDINDGAVSLSMLYKRIIVDDAGNIKPGQYIEIFAGTGQVASSNTVVESVINSVDNKDIVVLTEALKQPIIQNYQDPTTGNFVSNIVKFIDKAPVAPSTDLGPAGVNNELAKKSARTSVIKNFMTNSSITETDANSLLSAQSGTLQSSALVFNGPLAGSFPTENAVEPIDFVSYVYKPMSAENKFSHFGTRMRIIGRIDGTEDKQTPIGGSVYYSVTDLASTDKSITISGGSGGLGILINSETNNGYFLELIALTQNNVNKYFGGEDLHNVIFYKVGQNKDSTSPETNAIPVKLWGATTQIISDPGNFVGQERTSTDQNPTVYDIAIEYQDIDSIRRFYIYMNGKVIAVVDDNDPLPVYQNAAMFVRGSSRLMFENFYAVGNNYSQNASAALDALGVSSIFGDNEITMNEALRKYSLSGLVQSTYLSGISSSGPPKTNIYFDEFGTIMREASYFNVKYDKAFPALYAKMSPTFNNTKGYTVSGFMAGAYGAEFMIFNNTDRVLTLDDTSGNYLRIQGVTFTQQSSHNYSVDEHFSETGDFAKLDIGQGSDITSYDNIKKTYQDIKNSRLMYGKRQFNLTAPYIQDHDTAQDLMSWMISKILKPRKSVGLKVFGLLNIQLGDIVEIDYKANDSDIDQVALEGSRFVVYNIEYARQPEGPEMTIFVSEVM